MSVVKAVIAAASAAVLTACVTATPSEEAGVGGTPDPRVGPEVDSLCFTQSINNFRALDGESAVLLERGVDDWFRVETFGNCRAGDFRFARAIGLDDGLSSSCLRRGDDLLVDGPGDRPLRCAVTRINEWDEQAVATETSTG